MELVGHVESLWRYPVKSMRGEELSQAYAGAGGFAGDRRFAIGSSAASPSLPYLTSRAQERMLLYRPSYRDPAQLEPLSASPASELLDVETPSGESLAIHDPHLLQLLGEGLHQAQTLSLVSSTAALADEYPVSLLSLQTTRQLAEEFGAAIDKRRFRANIYANLLLPAGFTEDSFVGRRLKIGDNVLLDVVRRDPRCKVITLDPDTSEANPALIRHIAAAHQRCAGVYATVAAEGTIRQGDAILVTD